MNEAPIPPRYQDLPVLMRFSGPKKVSKPLDETAEEYAILMLENGDMMLLGRYEGDWREDGGWIANCNERGGPAPLGASVAEMSGVQRAAHEMRHGANPDDRPRPAAARSMAAETGPRADGSHEPRGGGQGRINDNRRSISACGPADPGFRSRFVVRTRHGTFC